MTHRQLRGGDGINRTLAGEWLTAGRFSAPPPAHVGRCVTDAESRTELHRAILTATSVSATTRRLPGCCSGSFWESFEPYLMSTLTQDQSLSSRNVLVSAVFWPYVNIRLFRVPLTLERPQRSFWPFWILYLQ